MKRLLLLAFAFALLTASAQDSEDGVSRTDAQRGVPAAPMLVNTSFGYASYDSLLRSMPDYAAAQAALDTLRARYDAEAKVIEAEFNEKYEEFLAGLSDFPQSILEKRQVELQEYLDRNVAFKEESRRLLAEAETQMFAPLHEKLREVLKAVGEKHGYLFIINTDAGACPFINEAAGSDVTEEVMDALR